MPPAIVRTASGDVAVIMLSLIVVALQRPDESKRLPSIALPRLSVPRSPSLVAVDEKGDERFTRDRDAGEPSRIAAVPGRLVLRLS